jgi:transposase
MQSPKTPPLPPCSVPGHFIGVDVAKDELVIAHSASPHAPPVVSAMANQAKAIAAWLATLPAGSAIAMESTGRYHQTLAQLSAKAGLAVYVLNAKDIYFYARALGTRGKSDRLDAQVILRYIMEHHAQLHTWSQPSTSQRSITELLSRRALLAKQQDALRKALAELRLPGRARERLLAQFDTCMKAIDTQVKQLVNADTQMRQDCARLRTVTGIGVQISALLANLFGRLQFANADALVAYSGLDPRPHESGKYRGQRRISKRGPALLRRQVWLAGFSASHSKVFAPHYQALRARGLSTTEAFLILGRKILRIAFAVYKSKQPFDASRWALAAPVVAA